MIDIGPNLLEAIKAICWLSGAVFFMYLLYRMTVLIEGMDL